MKSPERERELEFDETGQGKARMQGGEAHSSVSENRNREMYKYPFKDYTNEDRLKGHSQMIWIHLCIWLTCRDTGSSYREGWMESEQEQQGENYFMENKREKDFSNNIKSEVSFLASNS